MIDKLGVMDGYTAYTVPEKKGRRQALNAGVATAQVAAWSGLAYGGLKVMDNVEKFPKLAPKMRNFFEKIGEKVFRGKVGEIFKKCETRPGRKLEVILENAKRQKGKAALLLAAGAGILGAVLAGVFNAGRISAEKTIVVAED